MNDARLRQLVQQVAGEDSALLLKAGDTPIRVWRWEDRYRMDYQEFAKLSNKGKGKEVIDGGIVEVVRVLREEGVTHAVALIPLDDLGG